MQKRNFKIIKLKDLSKLKLTKNIIIPFPNFQQNTIISPTQMNDNFEEIEYAYNNLIDNHNGAIQNLEDALNEMIIGDGDTVVNEATRIENENIRISNEEERIANEISREEAEENRIKMYNVHLNDELRREETHQSMLNTFNSKVVDVDNAINSIPSKEELKGDKGDKGDAFAYKDFTSQQLEALRGPQGLQGPQGLKGDKGDTGEQGVQGIAGKDGLTTSIRVNNQTYTHLNGIITIPNYPSTEGLATKDYVNQEINKIDVTNQLTGYAKKSELPTKISQLTDDKGYITSIPSEYITETELNSKGYLTQHQNISHLALKTELHNHSNKSVLDNITSTKVTEWNNKSTFSGDYNDLTNKPSIPTVTNDLTNTLKSNYDKAYTHSQTTHFNGDYNSLTNKPTIPSLNGYATEEYVKNEIAKIDIPNLPNYWKDRLDEISPKIESLQKEYGIDAFQFLWVSDIHSVPGSSPNNTSYIGAIGRYMMDKHNIPFFTISGDIMSQGSHSTVDRVWNEYDKLNTMFSPIRNDEFLATKGNHDGAWGSPVDGVYYLNNIGTKELFNAFYRRQTLDRNRVFGKDGTYFYVDCPNVRFYMLNTHTDGDGSENSDGSAVYNPMKHFVLGNEQLNWIADTLLTVKDGQKVIFMGHAPTNYCLDGSIFADMIASYKNRRSYEGTANITGTYWGTDEKYSKVSVSKDFTNTKGDLVGYFHGHIHKDTISVDGYYPVVSITTAGGDLRDDYLVNGTLTRVEGTATETAIDLVTVTSDYIYCTRIGSGYDRRYNRKTKEVVIGDDSCIPPTEPPTTEPPTTNNLAIPNATNTTDTSIWVNNYRYSSSGLSVQNGTSVSNIILITKGDTIKISGVTLRENTDRMCVNTTQANGTVTDALGYFNSGISAGGVALIEYKGYENGVYTFYIPNTYSGSINHLRFAMQTPSDFSKVKVI